MYEGDEINSDSFDRPAAIVSSSPDEQQNAEPVNSPKPARISKKVDVPAPVFFETPAPAPTPQYQEPRSRNLRPIFIGIGALALVIVIVVVTVSLISGGVIGPSASTPIASRVNLSGLFDKTAPIPFRNNAEQKYGYVDIESYKFVIDQKYDEADPFYGDYAKVHMGERDLIINRKGETILDGNAVGAISYDIEENVWIAGENVYNGKMEKANEDSSMATYIGQGYAFVIPRLKEADKTTKMYTGIPYVVKVENREKVYECQNAGCASLATRGRTDGSLYLIITEKDSPATIVSLANKKVIYTADTGNTLSRLSNGVLIERNKKTGKTITYIIVTNGEAQKSDTLPTGGTSATSISGSDRYYQNTCDDGAGYRIVDKNNKELLGCSTQSRWYLSKNVYKKFEAEGKEVIVLQEGDGVHLYDLKEGKDIKVYENAGDAVLYENSPFIRLSYKSNKRQMCNLFELDKKCIDIKGINTVTFPTYFIDNNVVYSYNLQEVLYASK